MESSGKEAILEQVEDCTVGAFCGIDEKGKVKWVISGPVSAILGAVETMKMEVVHASVMGTIRAESTMAKNLEEKPRIVVPS